MNQISTYKKGINTSVQYPGRVRCIQAAHFANVTVLQLQYSLTAALYAAYYAYNVACTISSLSFFTFPYYTYVYINISVIVWISK